MSRQQYDKYCMTKENYINSDDRLEMMRRQHERDVLLNDGSDVFGMSYKSGSEPANGIAA